MQINSISSMGLPVEGSGPRPVARASGAGAERLGNPAPLDSEVLTRALDEVPDVRPEAVARGRELFADMPYPPAEIIQGISRLIANNVEAA
jgi:hypothetical protein